MIEKRIIDEFIAPYYRDKDIMHNMWHIELVRRQVEKIIAIGKYEVNRDVLEGGKTYTVVKTLITGSVRGQSLEETLSFMQKNVLGANKCYLPETIKMCNEMNEYTEAFYNELVDGIR